MGGILLAGAAYWLAVRRPWRPGEAGEPAPGSGGPRSRRAQPERGDAAGRRAGQVSGQAAYFWTRAPRFGSAAVTCLAALPRTVR